MADPRSPADDTLPSNPTDLREGPTNASVDRINATSPPPTASDRASTPAGEGLNGQHGDEGDEPTSAHPPPPSAGADQDIIKNVNHVLSSEIGIATLLNRLKQSIASAREFALFLKKRASLEEDSAAGLKKLCKSTQDNMHRPDHRVGSFAPAYDEMVYIHEQMAENESNFAASLHQMHDDLVELASNSERSRKNWKANGLSAEQKVADLEATMRKSKAKYDSLADEYERARTGEGRQSGKVFNAFKNKSAAQLEEDLLKKVQTADSTYHGHVTALQAEKSQLESTTRPEAIKSLQDLIKEMDYGLSLQMQKFAAFNEKLLLSNGLSISPIRGPGGETHPQSRSLRHAVMSIDNDKDLNDYVLSHYNKVPLNPGEVKYERNPVLNSHSSHLHQSSLQGPLQQPSLVPSQPPQGPPAGSSTTMGQGSSSASGPQDPSRPFAQPHSRSFSQGTLPTQPSHPGGPTPPSSSQHQHQHSQQHFTGNTGQPIPPPYGSRDPGPQSGGAPQLGALPFQGGQQAHHQPQQSGHFQPGHDRQNSGVMGIPAGVRNSPPPQAQSAPVKPVFGVPLSRLYERDGLAVPLVVYQCIQAVDLFGLGVEGIYRQSGSMNHIQKLKHMFDTESQSQALDFRNPENFYHDVNSVTGLLKQFFRDLPDPLLTSEHHDSFIAAAKHEDDTVRRDTLHAIINSLPDPNYATLRALSLHLFRVIDNAHVNRMNCHNLSLILGPTLMGTPPSAITDGGWQIKVIDTILQNTYQIFDED